MFRQVVQASEAMREAARQGARAPIPALSGCRTTCRTRRTIAAPALGGAEPRGAATPEVPGAPAV